MGISFWFDPQKLNAKMTHEKCTPNNERTNTERRDNNTIITTATTTTEWREKRIARERSEPKYQKYKIC